MKLSEFILLNEEAKNAALLHDGILIAKRRSFDSLVFLFQLQTFYVEMFGNLQTKQIDEYRVFDQTNPLNPYLEGIAIDSLF